MSEPLVTCLCCTKGRREWIPKAIKNFYRQTYKRKELLFVADCLCDVPAPLHFPVISRSGFNVGQKRNAGCEFAFGDLIAIWDDDDFSAPGRLSQQVAELERSGKSVTGYRAMKFTDGSAWWEFCYPLKDWVLATSMCFRRDWWLDHPFEPLQVGQDERFCAVAAGAEQLAECADLDLMYATIHPGNTSPRNVNRGFPWVPLPGFQWGESKVLHRQF